MLRNTHDIQSQSATRATMSPKAIGDIDLAFRLLDGKLSEYVQGLSAINSSFINELDRTLSNDYMMRQLKAHRNIQQDLHETNQYIVNILAHAFTVSASASVLSAFIWLEKQGGDKWLKLLCSNEETVRDFCNRLGDEFDKTIALMDRQAHFVANHIFKSSNFEMIRISVERWINVAYTLHQNANFFSAMAVMVALQMKPVERLYSSEDKRTILSEQAIKKFAKLLVYYNKSTAVNNSLETKIQDFKGAKIPVTMIIKAWFDKDKQVPDENKMFESTFHSIQKAKSYYTPHIIEESAITPTIQSVVDEIEKMNLASDHFVRMNDNYEKSYSHLRRFSSLHISTTLNTSKTYYFDKDQIKKIRIKSTLISYQDYENKLIEDEMRAKLAVEKVAPRLRFLFEMKNNNADNEYQPGIKFN